MHSESHIKEGPHGPGIGSLKSYGLGFLICLLLTLAAYFAVVQEWFSGTVLAGFVILLGILQIVAQLFLFIHLNSESKPRWNLIVFLFTALIIAIVVIGSLWIMANLNYRVMDQM